MIMPNKKTIQYIREHICVLDGMDCQKCPLDRFDCFDVIPPDEFMECWDSILHIILKHTAAFLVPLERFEELGEEEAHFKGNNLEAFLGQYIKLM